jgi:hypothetical protein
VGQPPIVLSQEVVVAAHTEKIVTARTNDEEQPTDVHN